MKKLRIEATYAVARWALTQELRRITSSPFPRVSASDLRRHSVGEHIEFRVMWIDRPGELGPTFSVFVADVEMLRVDLFESNPHLHPVFAAAIPLRRTSLRYAVPEMPVHELISWLCWDLEHNLNYHLAFHPRFKDPTHLQPDPEQLRDGLAWTRRELHDLVASHQGVASR